MYTILLPVDADGTNVEDAIDVITSLPADPEEINVVVLNVFKSFSVSDSEGGVVESEEIFDEDETPAGVERAVLLLKEHGIEPSIRREHGNVTETINNVAEKVDADQLIMAGRRRSPVGKALFGSTAQGVLQVVNRPVTIVLADS